MLPVSATQFCCGTGNASDLTCDNESNGSNKAFQVPIGLVINNRTSGSTGPNDTTPSSPGATTTVTASPSSSSSKSSSSTEAAIGAGVGVPLGIALLGALALLWRQRALEKTLKRKVETWEEKYEALARAKGLEYQQSGPIGDLVPPKENARLLELENSQAPNVFEMGGPRNERV